MNAGHGGADWLLPLCVAAGILPYLTAVYVQYKRGRSWSGWRTACFAFGMATLTLAILPPLAGFAHHDLRGHMVQHLLLGMLAPLGLVFAAPVTLALKTLPTHVGRRIVAFLHSRPVWILSHPLAALLFNIGGMYLLYLTPLYAAMLTHPPLHILVHVHFVMAGCLFTWAIAGPDPGPRRPGLRIRLGVLFLSMAAHAILAKSMYAYGWPRGTHDTYSQIQSAAQLMYYGGDLTELWLVIALFGLRYRAGNPEKLKRPRRNNPLKTAAGYNGGNR